MYSVSNKYMFMLLLLFYYWLLVSASTVHQQANIKKKMKCWFVLRFCTICTSILSKVNIVK